MLFQMEVQSRLGCCSLFKTLKMANEFGTGHNKEEGLVYKETNLLP